MKYQHILEKYFLTHHSKSRQPHLSAQLIVWCIVCPLPTRVHLLFAALKTALVQTFRCTCWCLYVKVEKGKTDHPPMSTAKSSISVLNHGSEDEGREPGMDCWVQEGLCSSLWLATAILLGWVFECHLGQQRKEQVPSQHLLWDRDASILLSSDG